MKPEEIKGLAAKVRKALSDQTKTTKLDPLTDQKVQNLEADRKLKKAYAGGFFWLLTIQLLFMNGIFVAVGLDELVFDEWTLELYVTGTILEVFGVVAIITKNLFPEKNK